MADWVRTVGVVSTGDMGSGVGRVLRAAGLRVVTYLGGRSDRTAQLASQADIEPLPDLTNVVREADLFLSLVPPASAQQLAGEVAATLRRAPSELVYADCNSIAPQTCEAVAATVSETGARVVDVSIIGQPPRVGQQPGPGTPRFYASGEAAADFAQLGVRGLDVHILDGGIGRASGLKMCYAALLKGLVAISTELLVAGERLDLRQPLLEQLEATQPILLEMIRSHVPRMPPKAYRWVGEMQEIAKTFGAVGMPPEAFDGAGRLFDLVARTALGAETPERRRLGTTLDEVVSILAGSLSHAAAPPAAIAPR